MTKEEINKINLSVKNIFKFIEKEEFDEALELFYSIKNIYDAPAIKSKLDFIESYINESKKYNIISKDENNSKIFEYLKLGNLSLFYEDYYTALQYFSAGVYFTKDPIFQYYIGVCYYYLKDYVISLNKLSNYVTNNSYKAMESYKYISNIYKEFIDNEYIENGYSKKYDQLVDKLESSEASYRKIKNIKNGIISKIERKQKSKTLKLDDNEIIELINNKKVNDVVELFEKSDYKRKIIILAILYKNGYKNSADILLKKNVDDFKINCPDELNALNRNKQLYLRQSKFKG